MKATSTCSSGELPVRASQSPDSAAGSKIRGAILRWSLQGWLFAHMPAGWCGRTCPAYLRVTADAILPRSCLYSSAGTSASRRAVGAIPDSSPELPEASAWVGECLTLNTPESNNFRGASRSDGDVSSLSDILEAAKVSPEFSLTANFARAILRRAEERGEPLPAEIESACRSILRTSTAG